ncbi:MAG: hypothetical protein RQ842_02040 [Vulcanisaeta sp.]|jgi:hypothetical protein|nr:hypothetical protein [Vulcanisaeta sp.]
MRYIEDEVLGFIRSTRRLLGMLELVVRKQPPNPNRDEIRYYALAIANALEAEIRELRNSLLDANMVAIDLSLADMISEKMLVNAVLSMINARPDDVVLLEHLSDGDITYTTPPNAGDLSKVIAEKLTANLLPEDAVELTAMDMAQGGYYLVKIVSPTNSVRYYLAKPNNQ